ncbi:hypothetical protein C1645_759781 [Glomus cerebriforme]|uniref:Uncharacterized protein n=1 Tax=Glomus cerebriforme TaxID=658196 RepID=A0A397TB97_9GLOM|nr:hypothetical protein C1645_759781 [Glomus cerebriforme]
MSPPNSFDEKPVVVKSKRGRKALAVSEGHIDVTGRTHIMTVRRSNPPTPKKKTTTPKAIKQTNNYCRRCEQNDEYIDVLNGRIGKLESLVEKLTNATKPTFNNNMTQPQPIVAPNFSNMGTEDLLSLSNQINVVLLERFEMQNQLQLQTQASMVTPITPITITPPVSPFTACEPSDIAVQDWTYNNPFTTY